MNDAPIAWYKQWRAGVLATSAFTRAPLPLGASGAWSFTDAGLARTDGRFFSITGMQYLHASRTVSVPMIHQPEVGLLAFAVRRAAEPEWLMQFKVEPGNTHGAQLAPTVQATLSNLQRAHQGEAPPLAELVTGTSRALLSNGMWSEQGSRFIGKRNENRNVLVDDDPALPANDVYRWVSASAVRALLAEEYAINTDARSVLATGPWDLIGSPDGPFSGDLRTSYNAPDRGIAYALDVLTQLHKQRPPTTMIPLAAVDGIHLEKNSATPVTHPYFDVHQVYVEAKTREVTQWDQPLVAAHGIGTTALLLFPDPKGILRARLVVDRSPGLTHSPEWTATIADVPGAPLTALPADLDVRAEMWCSDEGGRFDNSQQRRVIGVADAPPPTAPDVPYVDLTLGALERLVRTPGTVTNELRSAVALLLSLA